MSLLEDELSQSYDLALILGRDTLLSQLGRRSASSQSRSYYVEVLTHSAPVFVFNALLVKNAFMFPVCCALSQKPGGERAIAAFLATPSVAREICQGQHHLWPSYALEGLRAVALRPRWILP